MFPNIHLKHCYLPWMNKVLLNISFNQGFNELFWRSLNIFIIYNKLKVESLRQNWAELVQLADRLGHTLLKERRASFEQELDKQLKTFVVEVIQFRNAFDAQGPAVQGVRPAEAVQRLQDFQNRYILLSLFPNKLLT